MPVTMALRCELERAIAVCCPTICPLSETSSGLFEYFEPSSFLTVDGFVQWASLSLSALNEWNDVRKSSPPAKSESEGDVQDTQSAITHDNTLDCDTLSVDPLAGEALLYNSVEVDDVLGEENRCISTP